MKLTFSDQPFVSTLLVCKWILIFIMASPTLANAQPAQCNNESLTADSSKGMRQQGIIQHTGNVIFCNKTLHLAADELVLKQTRQQQTYTAKGDPVVINQRNDSFYLTAKSDISEYKPQQSSVDFSGTVNIKLINTDNSQTAIEADQLIYQFQNTDTDELTPVYFQAKGTPAKFQFSRQNDTEVIASAEYIEYSFEQQILTLTGNIRFSQGESLIKAEKLIYNVTNQSWEVPQMDNQRLEIIKKPES